MATRQDISVAVIGCGYWGPNLVRNFGKSNRCRQVSYCDANPGRLAEMRKTFPGMAGTSDYREVLEDEAVDAVAIATPVSTHYRLAQQALLNEKHVFIEKPLTASVDEAERLCALASETGRVLMVGHTFLYSPAVRKVKELITEGSLGAILHMHSQRLNFGRFQTDVSALWSLAPHDVSIANYLMDSVPIEVTASGGSFLTEGMEDCAYLTLTYAQGQVSHIHVSRLDPCKVRNLTIAGSNMTIVYDDTFSHGKVRVYGRKVSLGMANVVQDIPAPAYAGPDFHAPIVDSTEPLELECRHFIECVLDGRRPLTDGYNGLETVRVLEAAERSLAQRGAPVPISSLVPV